MKAFESISIANVTLKNRIIRSATYEGCCTEEGVPLEEYYALYEELAKGDMGAIITGFAFTSREGRAMQSKQAGIDSDEKIDLYTDMVKRVHKHNCPVFMQISHAGRQTTKARAGTYPGGASKKRSLYFRSRPKPFSTSEAAVKVEEYAQAANRARLAGLDGVQIHAAHGYLVHQFLLPAINKRKDNYGIDKKTNIGTKFLEEIILSIRHLCGDDYPILVKISGGTDLKPAFNLNQFRRLVTFLDSMKVGGIEISYGTMDHALNIIRGDFPTDLILKVNPLFNNTNTLKRRVNKLIINTYFEPVRKKFTQTYNLYYAKIAKSLTDIPIISVGGFRNDSEISSAIEKGHTDIVSLSRPFICEPDLVSKMIQNNSWDSACINCNYCSVMCDSGKPTKCYQT